MTQALPSARVAVDAMGGDYGLRVSVEGALAACRELGLTVLLVGPAAKLTEQVRSLGGEHLRARVVDAPDVVSMGERVTRSALKRRSSIQVAMDAVRTGAADAFFSAGNTAACWTIAKLVLGTLDEVDRPALAAVVPTRRGRTVLIDVGANASCKARQLEEFAVMGTVYTRRMHGIQEPRVGLMSMGEEESKGSHLTKEVHEALRGSHLNFVGNVEGQDIFGEKVDVVVMDGFTGNVVLKASEALGEALLHLLREELTRTPVRRLGAWFSRPALRAVQRRVDPSEFGGVPLLGVRGSCFIGHGRSTAAAIKHGIRAAAAFFASGVNEELQMELRALAARRGAAKIQGIA
jgi:glycerol-3-phosphate acyltransferase PlsX